MPTPPPVRPDPAIFGAMLRATIQGIPVNPNASEADIGENRKAAVIALTSLRPRDPIEAMLAARIVATNFAALACYCRAGLPDCADDVMLRLHAEAIALSNLATRLLRELRELQAEPAAIAAPREQPADTAPARDQVADDRVARAPLTTARLPRLAA